MKSKLSRALSTVNVDETDLLSFVHTTYEKNVLDIIYSGKIKTNLNEHLDESLCYFYYGMMRPQNAVNCLASYHNQFAFEFDSNHLIEGHRTLYPFDTGAVLRRLSQLPQYNHLTTLSAVESLYRLNNNDEIVKLIMAVYNSNNSYRNIKMPFSAYNTDKVIEDYMRLIENADTHLLTDSRLRFIELTHNKPIGLHACKKMLVLERSLTVRHQNQLRKLLSRYSSNVAIGTFSSQYNQELLKQSAIISDRLDYYVTYANSHKPFKARFMIDVGRNTSSYIKLIFTHNLEPQPKYDEFNKVDDIDGYFEINVYENDSETYLIHYSSDEIESELDQNPISEGKKSTNGLEQRFNRPIVYGLPEVFDKTIFEFSNILDGLIVFKLNSATLIKGDSKFVNKMILKLVGTIQNERNLYNEVATTCLQNLERNVIEEIVNDTIKFYQNKARGYYGQRLRATRDMNQAQENYRKFPNSNFIIYNELVYSLDESSTIVTESGPINTIDFFRMRNSSIGKNYETEVERCTRFLDILKKTNFNKEKLESKPK